MSHARRPRLLVGALAATASLLVTGCGATTTAVPSAVEPAAGVRPDPVPVVSAATVPTGSSAAARVAHPWGAARTCERLAETDHTDLAFVLNFVTTPVPALDQVAAAGLAARKFERLGDRTRGPLGARLGHVADEVDAYVAMVWNDSSSFFDPQRVVEELGAVAHACDRPVQP